MGAIKRLSLLLCAGSFVAACGKPVGLGATVTPLVEVNVQISQVSGASAAGSDAGGVALDGDGGSSLLDGSDALLSLAGGAGLPPLRVALVWGQQWWPEPFCLLAQAAPATLATDPTQLGAVESVAQAGCRDNFGFVPLQVGADVPLEANGTTAIPVISLPSAAEMVGDPAARVAYASLIIYQDGNGDGILDLAHPADQQQRGQSNSNSNDATNSPDTVYGASFISMTQPDQRVAYREGSFDPSVAFYPRAGCAAPPPSFSILSAGGFSVSEGLLSNATGQFPPETSCGSAPISASVTVALQAPGTLAELACTVNDASGVTYYRKPPAADPRTVGNAGGATISAAWACTNFPYLSGADGGVPPGQQLVVAGQPGQTCLGTLHYTLRGCNTNPSCSSPTWDVSASPPAWWPCSESP